MEHFYKCNYTPTAEEDTVVTHAKVFAMAVKYHVDGLRILTVRRFAAATEAMERKKNVEDDFVAALDIVYRWTEDGVTELRDIVADTVNNLFSTMLAHSGVGEALTNIPGLAFDVLKRSSLACAQSKHCGLTVKDLQCRNCKVTTRSCNKCSDDVYICCPSCGAFTA